jgi:hypothetical protein
MEWWSGGVVEWWSDGVVEWWSGGVVEWWSGGVVEWWSGGVVEWWVTENVVRRFDLSPAVRPRRKKAFCEACPRPHRNDALAQCRIGFQPVSPDHRTARRESGLFR